MPIRLLIDLLTGRPVLVNVPIITVVMGTFLFADGDGITFADGDFMDFIS